MPVDGAPSLGPNPYVGAAASAGSAAVSLLNSLRAAHDQQIRLDTQKRQQDAARQLQETNDYGKYLNEGAIPLDMPPDQNRPTIMKSPQDPYGGHDPNRVVEFPTLGKRLYIPTTGEKEDDKAKVKQKYDGKNSVSLKGDLAQQAQASGYNVDPNQEYSPAAAGQIRQGINDHNRQTQGSPEIDTEHFTRNGKPVIVRIDKAKGTYRELKPETDDDATLTGRLNAAAAGAQAAATAAAGNGNANDGTASIFPSAAPSATAPTVNDLQFNRTAPAAQAPKSLHFDKNTTDSGDVTLRGFDPETGELKSTRTDKGIGAKRKDPDAPVTKPGQGKPAQFQRVEKTKADRIAKAKQQFRKDMSESADENDKKAAADNLRSSLADAQNEYEASIGDLTGTQVAHNSWADKYKPGPSGPSTPRSTPPPPAAKAAAPKGQQKKTANRAQISAYAAKKYGQSTPENIAKATKEFQAANYTIQ